MSEPVGRSGNRCSGFQKPRTPKKVATGLPDYAVMQASEEGLDVVGGRRMKQDNRTFSILKSKD